MHAQKREKGNAEKKIGVQGLLSQRTRFFDPVSLVPSSILPCNGIKRQREYDPKDDSVKLGSAI